MMMPAPQDSIVGTRVLNSMAYSATECLPCWRAANSLKAILPNTEQSDTLIISAMKRFSKQHLIGIPTHQLPSHEHIQSAEKWCNHFRSLWCIASWLEWKHNFTLNNKRSTNVRLTCIFTQGSWDWRLALVAQTLVQSTKSVWRHSTVWRIFTKSSSWWSIMTPWSSIADHRGDSSAGSMFGQCVVSEIWKEGPKSREMLNLLYWWAKQCKPLGSEPSRGEAKGKSGSPSRSQISQSHSDQIQNARQEAKSDGWVVNEA